MKKRAENEAVKAQFRVQLKRIAEGQITNFFGIASNITSKRHGLLLFWQQKKRRWNWIIVHFDCISIGFLLKKKIKKKQVKSSNSLF